jgi:hypothetical protein
MPYPQYVSGNYNQHNQHNQNNYHQLPPPTETPPAVQKPQDCYHYKCPHCVVDSKLAGKRVRLTDGSKSAFKDIQGYSGLAKHIEDKHGNIYARMLDENKNQYVCYEPCCDWRFTNLTNFVFHIANNHPEIFGLRIVSEMEVQGSQQTQSHNHPWINGLYVQEITTPNRNAANKKTQDVVIPQKLLAMHQYKDPGPTT